jgi:DNA-binding NarL/FixJ family response regulator
MRFVRLLLVEDGAVLVRAAGNMLWEAEPDLLLNVAANDAQCLSMLQANPADLVIADAAVIAQPLPVFLEQVAQLSPGARVVLLHAWGSNPATTESQRIQAYRILSKRLADGRASKREVSESFARFCFSAAGQLLLSDQIYQDVSQSLAQLMQETGAAAVFLTDSNARVLSRVETVLKISPEQISAILQNSLSRIYETGQLPGHGLESVHLAYRGIERKNMYMFKVSGQLLLFLLVDSSGSDSYFEAVWNSSFQAVAQLRHLLNGGFGKTAPFAGIDQRVKQSSTPPTGKTGPLVPGSSQPGDPDHPDPEKPAYRVLL